MRKLFLICLIIQPSLSKSQDINWRSDDARHRVSACFGADYSSYYGISYGRLLRIGDKPLVAGAEVTFPFGRDLSDDWRLRASVQTEALRHNHFSLTIKPGLVVRRYESPLARMHNIAADVSFFYGYQKPQWGIAAVAGYDRSISTKINHRLLRDEYPDIKDGWYKTAGGNFKFGARANFSAGSWGLFLTAGKHYGQDFTDNPTFPFFAELTVQKRF